MNVSRGVAVQQLQPSVELVDVEVLVVVELLVVVLLDVLVELLVDVVVLLDVLVELLVDVVVLLDVLVELLVDVVVLLDVLVELLVEVLVVETTALLDVLVEVVVEVVVVRDVEVVDDVLVEAVGDVEVVDDVLVEVVVVGPTVELVEDDVVVVGALVELVLLEVDVEELDVVVVGGGSEVVVVPTHMQFAPQSKNPPVAGSGHWGLMACGGSHSSGGSTTPFPQVAQPSQQLPVPVVAVPPRDALHMRAEGFMLQDVLPSARVRQQVTALRLPQVDWSAHSMTISWQSPDRFGSASATCSTQATYASWLVAVAQSHSAAAAARAAARTDGSHPSSWSPSSARARPAASWSRASPIPPKTSVAHQLRAMIPSWRCCLDRHAI